MQMRLRHFAFVLLPFLLPAQATETEVDAMCGPVNEFLKSVQPDETRRLELHTSWGGNFKDSAEQVLSATRCDHHGYGPGQVLCKYLVTHVSVEFPGNNLKRLLMCLSPQSKLAPRLHFNSAVMSTMYGTKERGSNVEIALGKDAQIGGMVLSITADGY